MSTGGEQGGRPFEGAQGRDGHASGGGNARGPAGADFLHLEVSRWLEGEARGMGDGIIKRLLEEAVRARLEERLGGRLAALGAAIADEIADDLEANLSIESQIDARRDARKRAVERAQSALRQSAPAKKAKTKKRGRA